MYALAELTGERRYADEADWSLNFCFEHCQSPATGRLNWGEHARWLLHSGVIPLVTLGRVAR